MASLQEYQKLCRSSDVTIVSVSYKSSDVLKENIELTRKLNPNDRSWWLIVDNDFSIDQNWLNDDRVVIIPGTYLTEEESLTVAYGSFHHAKSLNVALCYARSDKILILDPDCFLIMRDAIAKILTHMEEKGLIFWGAPYHPTRLGKFTVWGRTYPYFPTVICMFLDRKKLQQNYGFSLDFNPVVNSKFYNKSYYSDLLAPIHKRKSRGRRMSSLWKIIKLRGWSSLNDILRAMPSKWSPDRRKDIGYQVYKLYNKLPFDYASVYYPRNLPIFFRLWKFLIPQYLTGYPKRDGYWIKEPMPYVPEDYVSPGRWEQFFFKGEPFAVHIGAISYRDVDYKTQLDFVLQAVCSADGVVI